MRIAQSGLCEPWGQNPRIASSGPRHQPRSLVRSYCPHSRKSHQGALSLEGEDLFLSVFLMVFEEVQQQSSRHSPHRYGYILSKIYSVKVTQSLLLEASGENARFSRFQDMRSYFPHASLKRANLQRLVASRRKALQHPKDISDVCFISSFCCFCNTAHSFAQEMRESHFSTGVDNCRAFSYTS